MTEANPGSSSGAVVSASVGSGESVCVGFIVSVNVGWGVKVMVGVGGGVIVAVGGMGWKGVGEKMGSGGRFCEAFIWQPDRTVTRQQAINISKEK